MKEEEIEKMLKELSESRKSYRSKITTSVKPIGSTNISGGAVGMDFASLYPSTMTIHFPSKQSRRKRKIKNIFDEGI
jgi:hypothetical protein